MRMIQTMHMSILCLIFITVGATAAAAGVKEHLPDQVTQLDKKLRTERGMLSRSPDVTIATRPAMRKPQGRFPKKTGSKEMR